MWNDLQRALRSLRRQPTFFVSAAATLALGVGLSSAIFCLIDGLWLRPGPAAQADRLARLSTARQDGESRLFSAAEAERIAALPAVAGVALEGGRGIGAPRPDGSLQMLGVNVVNRGYFQTLGLRAAQGRLLSPSGEASSIVISHAFWRLRFHSDPQIVGRRLLLRRTNRELSAEIVGVLPPDVAGVNAGEGPEIWCDFDLWRAIGSGDDLLGAGSRWFELSARLRPGHGFAELNAQLQALSGQLSASDPAAYRYSRYAAVSDARRRMQDAGEGGVLLSAVAVFVVLLCLINVAHLLLSQSSRRAGEMRLRAALGCDDWRMLRESLAMNLTLCAAGLAGGLSLALLAARLLPSLLSLVLHGPAMLELDGSLTHESPFRVDWRVFAMASLIAATLCAALSAVSWLTIRARGARILCASGAHLVGGREGRVRRLLIVAQISVAMFLLVLTSALTRSFVNARYRQSSLTSGQVLTLSALASGEAQRMEAARRLRQLPGVQSVACSIRTPLSLSEQGRRRKFSLPSRPDLSAPIEAHYNAIDENYLSVYGLRLVDGANFTAEQQRGGVDVAMVSSAFARKYWPGRSVVGEQLTVEPSHRPAVIVGVVADSPVNRIGEPPMPLVYLPLRQEASDQFAFSLATSAPAMSLARAGRDALVSVSSTMAPWEVTSLEELERFSTANYQCVAALTLTLGGVGALLTAVGFFGFLAFRVERRRAEIGVRMALGADRASVLALIGGDAARLVLAGCAAGSALAWPALWAARSLLYGVGAWDWTSLACALATFVLAALPAVLTPALRAARMDPMSALRAE